MSVRFCYRLSVLSVHFLFLFRLYLIYIIVNFLQVVFGHFVIQFLKPSTVTGKRNSNYNQNGSKIKDRQQDKKRSELVTLQNSSNHVHK